MESETSFLLKFEISEPTSATFAPTFTSSPPHASTTNNSKLMQIKPI